MKIRRSTKMDTPKIWENLSDDPLATGYLTNQGMIFVFEISEGPEGECNISKPNTMEWQVDQTFPSVFQDC